MVPDIEVLQSHPDKLLLTHIEGVRLNTKKLTNSKIAELVALFHDLGKVNPNFQRKLISNRIESGYANHSYLSAFAFFCAFGLSVENKKVLKHFLKVDTLTQNALIALIVLIAKHHSNLPDFTPECQNNEAFASILSKDENEALYHFLELEKNLPVYEFINHFIPIDDFRQFLLAKNVQLGYSEKLVFRGESNISALDFFLDNQFAFACVIQADKADAGKIGNVIDEQREDVMTFSKRFSSLLNTYLTNLDQASEINKLRTIIRNNSVVNIRLGLQNEERIYELTAPTGSGKTLMMLTLASEIIKEKGAKRIIYALPFLSITEQVAYEVLKIFKGNEDFIQRIDSKSENVRFEKLQEELNNNPSEEKIIETNILEFQENTFAVPFIITTFVRFFETLLSNRNGELLKLPNFSKSIFLIDEIQALPPRLYGFFVAYIRKFCEKFDSYAVISTATQPNFEMPKNNINVRSLFPDYKKPSPLLPLSYFDNNLFNRYSIEYEKEPIDLEFLKESILKEKESVLIILNTIDDTKQLFKKLQDAIEVDELLLLNTHFTPQHRKLKIYLAKRRLSQNKRVVVVSTQLIEAGVDIDFPILYRDFATVASIVQSAGRCNRNGKLGSNGKVKLFKLQNKGKIRSDLIYQGKDKEILQFTKESFINRNYQEKELLEVQKTFFNKIQAELNFAQHSQNCPKLEFDFIKDIQECQFNKIGKFQLIDEQVFGVEIQYFVPRNHKDDKFEKLLTLQDELTELFKIHADQKIIRSKRNSIKLCLRSMSDQIVQIRIRDSQVPPIESSDRRYFNLRKINRTESYSFTTGVALDGQNCII